MKKAFAQEALLDDIMPCSAPESDTALRKMSAARPNEAQALIKVCKSLSVKRCHLSACVVLGVTQCPILVHVLNALIAIH